ncbi:MAG: hypothetical protein GKR89_25280 [Candidatus Latescibacteria bacterium]|nr:hypothetical protein [Candidatus Latescibacterota bacterium]
MTLLRTLLLPLLLAIPAASGQSETLHPQDAKAPDFYAHWGDGQAEISSYKIVQPRYGQERTAYGVMIFVTEEINRQTLIKVESDATPPQDRLYVLKLNNVLKFTTGIYDYSVMTSVFSQVEGSDGPFQLHKVNLSAQEWCGHVYDEIQVRDDRLVGHINSYFESEGQQAYQLDAPSSFASEDHLLIQIRELKEALLPEGGTMEMALLPSLWSTRQAHRPHQLYKTTLHKGAPTTIAVGGRQHAAIPWTWESPDGDKTVWVEQAYPRRILAWREAGGGSGQLQATLRKPYWRLHGNQDQALRDELGIPR